MVDTSLYSGSSNLAPATTPGTPGIPGTDRKQDVFQTAETLYHQGTDWVTFFREVLGLTGLVRRNFTDANSLNEFEKTPEYGQIQKWVAKLREQNRVQPSEQEPTRVITVRMPKSLHEALRAEAHDRHTSMNKLCISKLLQMIDDTLVPHEV
jgi:predicted HicB family RNase H-like nuclease